MRITAPRFSVPKCIFDETLPHKTICLLLYLLSRSDIAGRVNVSYATIKEVTGIGGESTVANSIRILQRNGWFHRIRKTGRSSIYFLRIPDRYVKEDQVPEVSEKVVSGKFKYRA